MTAKIVIAPDTWAARTPQSNVTGIIYLEVDGRSFPDSQWSDFPIIVLGWWLKGLADLAQGLSSSCEGLFMDGPFSFQIEQLSPSTLKLVQQTSEENDSAVIDFHSFYASVLAAAEQAVQACQSRDWMNADLANLKAALLRATA